MYYFVTETPFYFVYLLFAHKISILMAVNFLSVDIKTKTTNNKRQNIIMLTYMRPAFDEQERKTNQNKVSEKVEPVLIRTILNVFIHNMPFGAQI